jgi:hypothetical protein
MIGSIATVALGVGLCALAGAAHASQECSPLEEDLVGFLSGTYALIGRTPSGESTYAGTAVLSPQGCGLRIVRCEEAGTFVGEAEIAYATADRIPVLRSRHRRGEETVRGQYLIDGDLDNTAVLTGTYVVGDDTENPGREYLFVDRDGGEPCSD